MACGRLFHDRQLLRYAVHSRTGRVDDTPDASLAGRIQHMQKSLDIRPGRLDWMLDRSLYRDLRRQMQNSIDTDHGGVHGRLIADIGCDQLEPRVVRQVFPRTRRQIIQDRDRQAGSQQSLNRMRTDKAGSAGYQNVLH